MNKFLTYIEETLHLSANISKYNNLSLLPLYLRNGYNLYIMTSQNVTCLLVEPKEQANLTVLRKQISQLKKLTGIDSVLCLDNVGTYTKDKMLSEGIPFVIAGQQIYMPFWGIALSKNSIREIPHKEQISFSTQKLILTVLYEGLSQMTLTETAAVLGVSKMSITRIFDELQVLGLNLVKMKGKTRCFSWENGRRALWKAILPFLRNPVAKQYRLGGYMEISVAKLGGMSAVCHYSMLGDNPYTIYAITKKADKELELKKMPLIPDNESPVMVVHVMHYDLEYQTADAIDPLTAILSLTQEDKEDPRVEAAIEDVLEDCLHD